MLSPGTLFAYLPQDRRESISAKHELSHQTQGAVLWADLSGFTPLTESLARKLGKRRGAEELALQLNRFYEALIAPVEAYGGSVVDFSGDAINCWFDADDGRRALAAAQAMQIAMQPFANLQLPSGDVISVGVKLAVASGSAHRLQVGDPVIQTWDTLAGAIMDRLAMLGHLAHTGELLLDEPTEAQLHEIVQISEWRATPETGERAAVVSGLKMTVELPRQALRPDLTEEQVRPWLLPAVFARLQGGQGEFLTELRPAVALFMRFEGLDYDRDDQAGEKLDIFIRRVQRILSEYEGTLLQLTLGDKGSYLYAAFGAPLAHENDITRAVTTALELLKLPTQVDGIHSVNIGLSQGTMRTGAYGSTTRRTYGVLGDEVNLAARLMQRATPGQILASQTVWKAASDFEWQVQPAIEVKGKHAAVTPAILLGRHAGETLHTHKTITRSPMIGRQAELALIEEKLALARQGQGQIVSITAEAGMGKSRLMAEVLQNADNLTRYSGECQSHGTQSSYLVWHSIWRAFFGISPVSTSTEQIATLEKTLTRINPNFLLRLPLLGAALNLSIPDNGLTNGMDARARKTSRESLLVDCIRAWAGETPLVLALEDLHWIDPLSRDLLEGIGRAIRELPVLILLVYRPPAESETAAFLPILRSLEYATEVPLAELTRTEIEQLIASRLAHFGLEGDVPLRLVEHLSARAQGNPFYIEELLNYLHDRGLDPLLDASWEQADLPDSLHRLILSRIDQLGERQQITIKTASVIGRLFRAAWLYEYYPPLGGPAQVSADLEILNRMEFTLLETPEPELAYLFKHVITQEVAYESLAYATRATLHEQFAQYLEITVGNDTGPFLDLLAYHYEHSSNLPKKREYLRRAGEAAMVAYANESALSYLGRALALVPEGDHAEQFDICILRDQVHNILAKREAQEKDLTVLAALAENLNDNLRRAQVAISRIRYADGTSNYTAAITAAQQAVEFAHLAGGAEYEARAYWRWGEVLERQGNYVEARSRYEQALDLAQTINLTKLIADSLTSLGFLELSISNYDTAQIYLERALQLQREISNLIGETLVLGSLGDLAFIRGDFSKAYTSYEQVLDSFRLVGYKQNEGYALTRLGTVIIEQRGDYAKARLYCEQALILWHRSGDRAGKAVTLHTFSTIDLLENNYDIAHRLAKDGLLICQEIGYKYYEGAFLRQLGSISDELGEYILSVKYHRQELSFVREMGKRNAESTCLIDLGASLYHLGQFETALEDSQQALRIAEETKNQLAQTRALTLQGHILREMSSLDQAAKSYHQALRLALDLGLDHYIKQAQTGLACIALIQGNHTESQVTLDEILNYLETANLSTTDEIFWICLTCYRILQANADPRAIPTLKAAYGLLQQIAARIDDETMRTSFLQNVRSNREIVQAWESIAAP